MARDVLENLDCIVAKRGCICASVVADTQLVDAGDVAGRQPEAAAAAGRAAEPCGVASTCGYHVARYKNIFTKAALEWYKAPNMIPLLLVSFRLSICSAHR